MKDRGGGVIWLGDVSALCSNFKGQLLKYFLQSALMVTDITPRMVRGLGSRFEPPFFKSRDKLCRFPAQRGFGITMQTMSYFWRMCTNQAVSVRIAPSRYDETALLKAAARPSAADTRTGFISSLTKGNVKVGLFSAGLGRRLFQAGARQTNPATLKRNRKNPEHKSLNCLFVRSFLKSSSLITVSSLPVHQVSPFLPGSLLVTSPQVTGGLKGELC